MDHQQFDLETGQLAETTDSSSLIQKRHIVWMTVRHLVGLIFVWTIFYGIFRMFPYLSAGADVVYRAKLTQEMKGKIFPTEHHKRRVIIFGNSKVLAGFIPDYFDEMAATNGLNYYSYNSGYPAREVFVPQLKAMVDKAKVIPDILLLTQPWQPTQQHISIFDPFQRDHDIAEQLFPFRFLLRDTLSFLITSRAHGGPINFYSTSRENAMKVIADRGYYFVSEQSHYPGDRLPDDYHLSADRPNDVALRTADEDSKELKELDKIINSHHIRCYFVPQYLRMGERAPAPQIDHQFADIVRAHSSCKLLGPDYYSYPNRMFSDPAHLNGYGARIYTQAIYRLIANEEGNGH